MKVYKYRGLVKLDRTLKSLAEDCFYAPTAAILNDPTEAVLNDKLVAEFMNKLSPKLSAALEQLTTMRTSVGIYSLSKTATDELMWAHYASSHEGFCIEYDLDRLVLEARNQWSRVDVTYSREPPTLTLHDVIGAPNARTATAKLIGHKSLRWNYEDELRLVTARSGANFYARAALTAIYFGCRCKAETEAEIRSALRNRSHSYFRMAYPPHSYQLTSIPLPRLDVDGVAPDYAAPVEDGAVISRDDLGEFADRHELILKAVDIVRRDPSCKRIVLADLSSAANHQGQIFVQFETSVKTDLYGTLNWYFEDAQLRN